MVASEMYFENTKPTFEVTIAPVEINHNDDVDTGTVEVREGENHNEDEDKDDVIGTKEEELEILEGTQGGEGNLTRSG
jgi:hypothetical protein